MINRGMVIIKKLIRILFFFPSLRLTPLINDSVKSTKPLENEQRDWVIPKGIESLTSFVIEVKNNHLYPVIETSIIRAIVHIPQAGLYVKHKQFEVKAKEITDLLVFLNDLRQRVEILKTMEAYKIVFTERLLNVIFILLLNQ